MKIHPILVLQSLLINKEQFYLESIKLFNEIQDTEFDIILHYDFMGNVRMNQTQIIEELNSIFDGEPSKFKLIGDYPEEWVMHSKFGFLMKRVFGAGKLYYHFLDKKLSEANKYNLKLEYRKVIDQKIDTFFNNEFVKSSFESLSNIDFYSTIKLPSKDVHNIKKRNFLINIEGMQEFFKKTIELQFNQFQFNEKISTKNIYRFEKSIHKSGEVFFGIEIHLEEWKKDIITNFSVIQPGINFIAYTKDFYKNHKSNFYYVNAEPEIINLGEIEHPFITKLWHINTYNYRINHYYIGEEGPFYVDLDPFIVFNELDEDTFEMQISDSNERAMKIKKYLFYYYAVLAKTSECYIKYLEKSVLESLNLEYDE